MTTTIELKKLARAEKIPKYYRMNKPQLLGALGMRDELRAHQRGKQVNHALKTQVASLGKGDEQLSDSTKKALIKGRITRSIKRGLVSEEKKQGRKLTQDEKRVVAARALAVEVKAIRSGVAEVKPKRGNGQKMKPKEIAKRGIAAFKRKPKPEPVEQKIKLEDVKTPSDRAKYAKQEAAHQRSLGNEKAAKAWDEKAKEGRQAAIRTDLKAKSTSQTSLFGVTDHASDMPLFGGQPSQPPKVKLKEDKAFHLYDVADIKISKKLENDQSVHRIADAIVAAKGEIAAPIILIQKGEGHYEVADDPENHKLAAAAVLARKKDPRSGEMVSGFAAKNQEEADAFLYQRRQSGFKAEEAIAPPGRVMLADVSSISGGAKHSVDTATIHDLAESRNRVGSMLPLVLKKTGFDKHGGEQYEVVSGDVAIAVARKAKQLDPRRAEMVHAIVVHDEPKAKGGHSEEPAKRTSAPSGLAEVSPHDLHFDPKRFQYKMAHGAETGSSGSLTGVGKWDENLGGVMQIWRDPKDGKDYVVNGHNRATLARKLGAEKVAIRYLAVDTAHEARSIAALTNISEGSGSSLDAAKFFRDSGISREDLEKKGIPMKQKIATDGLALSKLAPHLFDKVVQGDIPVERATLIGDRIPDHDNQTKLIELIDKAQSKGRKITNDVVRELADTVQSAPSHTETQFNLFGAEESTQNLALEKAELMAHVRSRLSREKKLFGLVSKNKAAAELERGGNSIDTEKSKDISDQAGQVLNVFDQLKNQSGPVSHAINKAVERIANGENNTKVRDELHKQLLEEIPEALGIRKRGSANRDDESAEGQTKKLRIKRSA